MTPLKIRIVKDTTNTFRVVIDAQISILVRILPLWWHAVAEDVSERAMEAGTVQRIQMYVPAVKPWISEYASRAFVFPIPVALIVPERYQ
jgi:hypothetical protein